ncbi:hypothetical protein GF362_05810 [Candidatus Dojkabacteria bacterium]|nr:hypothetical protein [Candidatus Dojkabacteria bacterium]
MEERYTYNPDITIPHEALIQKINPDVLNFVRSFIVSAHCKECPIGINVCDPRFDGNILSGKNVGSNECYISQQNPFEVSLAGLMDITQPFWRGKAR